MLNKEDFELILKTISDKDIVLTEQEEKQFPVLKKKLELIINQISLTEKYQEEAGKIRDDLQALQPEK